MYKTILTIAFFATALLSFSQNKIDDLLETLENTLQKEERLNVLNDLTEVLVKANDDRQLSYLKQYVSLAQELNEYDLAARKSSYLFQYYSDKAQIDSAKNVADKMLGLKDKFKRKTTEAHVLLKRASYFFNTDQYDKAAREYNLAGDIFLEAKEDSIFAADARYFAAQVYDDSNEFVNSIKSYQEAYELYKILGDESYANYALDGLAILYGKNGFYKKAIHERNRILKSAKKLNDYDGMAITYGHLAKGYFDKRDYSKVRRYIDSATNIVDSIEYIRQKNTLKYFLASLNINFYLKIDSISKAAHHLNEAEKYATQTSAVDYFMNELLPYKAKVYNKQKKYAKAEAILKKLIAQKGQKGRESLVRDAEREIAKVYATKNNYKEAYNHLSSYIEQEQEDNSIIKNNTFLYYQNQFESQRKDNEILKQETEIQLLEKDKEIATNKRKTLWTILISIIIVAILVSYFIWKQGKQKRDALSAKIEKNKKDLKEYTNQLLEKRKVQESLTKEIERLKEEVGEQKSTENLQDLTTVKILTNDDWYTFKEKFTNVYPNFFVKIKKKGYELTKSEERLIAMEKLYLDTNQIASMLAISNDSVTKSRSRLRKKLNAPRGSSILNYLEAS